MSINEHRVNRMQNICMYKITHVPSSIGRQITCFGTRWNEWWANIMTCNVDSIGSYYVVAIWVREPWELSCFKKCGRYVISIYARSNTKKEGLSTPNLVRLYACFCLTRVLFSTFVTIQQLTFCVSEFRNMQIENIGFDTSLLNLKRGR